MNWVDVTDNDLEEALAAVKYEHDSVAARNLMEYFHERFREGSRYNERILLEFVGYAFQKIVEEDWTADQAFGLQLRRGHYPRENTDDRDATITAYIILLMRRGWTWIDAKNEAANLLFPDGKGDRVVEKVYANLKDEFSECPDDVLIRMLPVDTSLKSRT